MCFDSPNYFFSKLRREFLLVYLSKILYILSSNNLVIL